MLTALPNEAKIYRWKDKNGNWVYSDTPKKGAQQVKLNKPLVMPSINTEHLNANNTKKTISYQANITSPSHEQTIRENTGTVYVTGQVMPSFQRGFTVQLFHNGTATGERQSSTSFVLKALSRGEHKIQMAVFNPQGKKVATSQESIFFLHKARVGNR
ncbi:DUF4124 domain-containing protein [Pseudoalteromonas phenolica O-BC30]|nr:hypothetical protein [Pseudoalteromonas phenolica O-BC30]RXF02401.1 DUF4124 domain-containing protein [Pseudoalteromonas phenolica O-BC30]TMO53312.1 DUF4124 domain-containing protein [Pseudoalteromonas phenolica]